VPGSERANAPSDESDREIGPSHRPHSIESHQRLQAKFSPAAILQSRQAQAEFKLRTKELEQAPLRVAVSFLLLVFPLSSFAQSSGAVLNSPDGRLAIALLTVEKSPAAARGGQPAPSNVAALAGGQLVYTLSFQGKLLIEPSALRLDLQGQTQQLGQDVRIVRTTPSEVDETYRLVAGRASSVRNSCNALAVLRSNSVRASCGYILQPVFVVQATENRPTPSNLAYL
jgi:hypothetical protein